MDSTQTNDLLARTIECSPQNEAVIRGFTKSLTDLNEERAKIYASMEDLEDQYEMMSHHEDQLKLALIMAKHGLADRKAAMDAAYEIMEAFLL